MKSYTLYLVCLSGLLLTGCVGSPLRNTLDYDSKQSAIQRNNHHLLQLHVGQTSAEVQAIMGDAERSEGYSWGNVWLYRTAFTSGLYGTADNDFTPVVIAADGHLSGWGRNYFQSQINKYQVEIINHN